MLIQKFWRKRVMVIGAIVFVLTLCALNLNALVKGKVEILKANALPLIYLFKAYQLPGGGYICAGPGGNCIIIHLIAGGRIEIPLFL